MIGSCTNGGYDDLLQAALVLRAARALGRMEVAGGREFVVFPGSGKVKQLIENADPTLDTLTVNGGGGADKIKSASNVASKIALTVVTSP